MKNILVLSLQNLGRDIGQSAASSLEQSLLAVVAEHRRHSEVRDLQHVVRLEKQILGLYVPEQMGIKFRKR